MVWVEPVDTMAWVGPADAIVWVGRHGMGRMSWYGSGLLMPLYG